MICRLFLLSLLTFCFVVACSSSDNDGGTPRDAGAMRADGGHGGRDAQVTGSDGGARADSGMVPGDSGMTPKDGGAMSTDASTQTLCEQTGGTVEKASCCAGAGDFPNTCTIGGCGCSPSASVEIKRCTCPAGGCYTPTAGCSIKVCTPGADQTCNDNPMISALHGKCLANGTCECKSGFKRSVTSGKCL